ncbi:hypothetical protein AC579_8459 [Pseudocercospora musae]|uniref:Protein kinase domain-containing protein n=1 Tax=Pseudocercospora musae TaxID=113226 RepID=A0A139GT26_9PEZI|nr:hypothetical protein AC579_8459 [Pseudocercospora musae]
MGADGDIDTHSHPESPIIFVGNGEMIGSGVSGIIELLPNGKVLKSPWPGEQALQCKKDILLESEVYRRLQDRGVFLERFVKFVEFDAVANTITLEHMPAGTLRDHLEIRNQETTVAQRFAWALQASQALEALHSVGVAHCDFCTKNILLSDGLELKVIDFGCSSIDGKLPSGGGQPHFYPQGLHSSLRRDEYDVFALGSTIYEIFTGKRPYHDLSSQEAQAKLSQQELPDLTSIPVKRVIEGCWALGSRNAANVRAELEEMISAEDSLRLS